MEAVKTARVQMLPFISQRTVCLFKLGDGEALFIYFFLTAVLPDGVIVKVIEFQAYAFLVAYRNVEIEVCEFGFNESHTLGRYGPDEKEFDR